MVKLASLLFVDPIDCYNELAIVAPLVVLLALHSLVAALGLVCGFSLSLTLVLQEYCADSLLRSLWFAMSELMDECLIGCARDERSNHVRVHDIRELIALLGEAVDVLM